MIATQGVFPSRAGTEGAGGQAFIGEVRLFAGDFALTGYKFADGRLMSIEQNTALFSILGTNYGGDGQETFALPDLCGTTLVGVGSSDHLLGAAYGSETVTLKVANLLAHAHDLPASQVAPTFTNGTPPASVIAGGTYSFQFAASGFPAPTFSASALENSGLTLYATSGVLSGTPTVAKSYFITVVQSDERLRQQYSHVPLGRHV